MPLGPDPAGAHAARQRLDALRDTVSEIEEDLLSCLVITGEPRAQRVLDDWLDQVLDTARAVGETAAELSGALSRALPDAGSPRVRPTSQEERVALEHRTPW